MHGELDLQATLPPYFVPTYHTETVQKRENETVRSNSNKCVNNKLPLSHDQGGRIRQI